MINTHTLSYILWAAISFGCVVIHYFVDWYLQNDWIAKNKFRWVATHPQSRWGFPHPTGIIHAASHGIALLLLLPWWAAGIVAIAHWLIDLRSPLAWWKKVFRQTREGDAAMHVGMWSDQTAHIVVIALVVILVV